MVVVRFAPSPTGYLHIGGARTALFNYLYAKHHNGKFLLRIEDTDLERSTDQAKQAIFDSLAWLGLHHDGDYVLQSTRQNRHAEVAHQLVKRGKAYYCYSSQEEIDGLRQEAIRNKQSFLFKSPWRDAIDGFPTDRKPVVRLKVNHEGVTEIDDLVQGKISVSNDTIDDMVLLRSDGMPTYMLAVVVDDHDMGITHIIRGDDHLNNAFRQYQIYKACEWKVPSMSHIPLIHGDDGEKLSKRHGAVGVEWYREQGYLPEALCNYLVHLGWSHGDEEIISRENAIQWFDISNVRRSPSRIDFAKMRHINAYYLREMPDAEFVSLLMSHVSKSLVVHDNDVQSLTKAVHSIKSRSETMNDAYALCLIYCMNFQVDLEVAMGNFEVLYEKLGKDVVYNILSTVAVEFSKLDLNVEMTSAGVKDICLSVAKSMGLKLNEVMDVIRVAMTSQISSPSVFEMMAILGVDLSLKRIRRYI